MNNHMSPHTGFRFPGVSVAISVIIVPSWHSHLSLNLRSYTVSREMQEASFGWAMRSLEAQCLYFFVVVYLPAGPKRLNVMSYECSCSIFRTKLAQCGLPGVPVTTAVNRHSSLVRASRNSTWNELKLVHLLQEDVMNLKEHLGETSCLMFCCQFLICSEWHQYELRCIYSKTLEKWNFVLFVSCYFCLQNSNMKTSWGGAF